MWLQIYNTTFDIAINGSMHLLLRMGNHASSNTLYQPIITLDAVRLLQMIFSCF